MKVIDWQEKDFLLMKIWIILVTIVIIVMVTMTMTKLMVMTVTASVSADDNGLFVMIIVYLHELYISIIAPSMNAYAAQM